MGDQSDNIRALFLVYRWLLSCIFTWMEGRGCRSKRGVRESTSSKGA